MTEDELLALLSTSQAGIRGAQNATLASTRTPLAQIEASAPPAYRVPLMRAGGTQDFVYPGFGLDPELNPGVTVPPGGTVTSGGGAPAPASGVDINALLAGLGGGAGVPAGSGGGGGSNLGNLAGGAGLTIAALSALLKAAPWLARQLGLTEAQAAQLTGPGGIPFGDMATQPYAPLPGDTATNIGMASGEGIQAGVSAIPWDQMLNVPANGMGIFTPDANAPAIPNANTLNPELPPGLDNSTIGPPQQPQDGGFNQNAPATVNTSDFIPLPTGTLPSDASGVFTAPPPASGGTLPDNASGIFTPDEPQASVNFGDFAPAPDVGGGAGGWDPGAGAGEWGGTGTDVGGSFSGPLIDPGSLGIPDTSFNIAGFDVNPLNLGAGALGSYVGGRMAEASVRGDEQQPWASKLGGLAGGGIGTLILPGIGTLIGSLLGSNLAGQLGAGEPDDPFAAFDAQIFNGEGQGGFGLGGVYTSNGGTGTKAEALRTWLLDQINARAAAEGLVANPEMVNQIGFAAGYHNRPGYSDPLFYRWREPGAGARPDDATWRGTDDAAGRQGLLDMAYGDLTGKGFFTRPGTTASWQDVKSNIDQQREESYRTPVYVEHGEAGGWSELQPNDNPTFRGQRGSWAGPQGYTTYEESGGGEAGTWQTPIWHEGAPSAAPESQVSTSMPDPQPEPMNYDQGGAAREGGLIPPTPGGTQPVPLTAHTGEFVIRPEAVQQFGPEMLTAINRGTFPAMPGGGETDYVEGADDIAEMGEEDGMGESEDDDEHFGPWTRAYGDVSSGPSPFERVTAEGEGADPMAAMRDLPQQVQTAMLATLGADPMVASAWLRVLGPRYQRVIAEALKAGGMMKQAQAQAAMMQQPPGMAGAPGPMM